MSELVLVNVSGRDKPGLTSEITGIMGRYDVRILDIGQAVIHDHLTWGILIEIPDESKSSPVIRDLLFSQVDPGHLPDHPSQVDPGQSTGALGPPGGCLLKKLGFY